MIWFLNYQRADSISIDDRGLAYGDGVFETAILNPASGLQNSSFHYARLVRSLRRLSIPFPLTELQRLEEFIRNLSVVESDRKVIKIIVTRGQGGRGYSPPEIVTPNIAVGIGDVPDYDSIRATGIALSVASIFASSNRSLAGMKHLCRLENVLAKQTLASGAFEALMVDENKILIEGIQSNVIWCRKGLWYTPALHRSGVQGSMRAAILRELPVVNIGQYTIDDIIQADVAYLINGVAGILPIVSVNGIPIGKGAPTLNFLPVNFLKRII